MKQQTIERRKLQKEERSEEKHSRKAFNHLIRMAKIKGALVEVTYSTPSKPSTL